MIALAQDCLLFQMPSGESVPFSADMISIELLGSTAEILDMEIVTQTCHAVFHYFKNDLRQGTVTMEEFAAALEKALRGVALGATSATSRQVTGPSADCTYCIESDLSRIACESGKGCELFFFPLLRDELREQLRRTPNVIRFCGLRKCVKQLVGAQRWSGRCRTMRDHIVSYLRQCLSDSPGAPKASLVVC